MLEQRHDAARSELREAADTHAEVDRRELRLRGVAEGAVSETDAWRERVQMLEASISALENERDRERLRARKLERERDDAVQLRGTAPVATDDLSLEDLLKTYQPPEWIFDDLKAPMKAITAWLASKKGVPEPEGPTADEIEEYCNGVDADECSIDLVEQLRKEASIMRKADPSGMQRWNEEYCSSDEACEAGMPDL